MARQAVAGYTKTLGLDSAFTQDSYDCLGHVYAAQGKYDEADRTFLQIMESCERSSEPDSDDNDRHRTALNLVWTLHLQCQERYKELQPNTQGRQAKRKSASLLSHQILRLTVLAQKYGSSENYIFSHLGNVLNRVVSENQSRIAYQQQARREGGTLRYTTIFCGGCRGDITTDRFVCLHCDNINFCKKCSSQYKKGSLKLEQCAGHELLDVSLSFKLGFKKRVVYSEESGKEWLKSLVARYKDLKGV
jgi:Tetratricopeptide repeat